MPIARLTNVTGWSDFLTELKAFLDATGDWTSSLGASGDPDAGGSVMTAQNGDCLAGLRSTSLGVGTGRLYLFDGIPPRAGQPPDALPGNSGISISNYDKTAEDGRLSNPQFSGPFPTVTLFTDDPSTYCHCVIEVVSGRFRHLYFGNMTKFGSWTGGAYYGLTYWPQTGSQIDQPATGTGVTPFDGNLSGEKGWTFHYEDAGADWRAGDDATVGGVPRKQGLGSVRGGFGNAFRNIQETPWSGLIALNPVTLWAVENADDPETVRCMGQIPDMAELNVRHLAPGESYFIGADEWVVFPLVRKADPTESADLENTGYFGMAFLVRP
jgi:hypothetical protein